MSSANEDTARRILRLQLEVLERRLQNEMDGGEPIPATLHREIREIIQELSLYEGLIGTGEPQKMDLPKFEADPDDPHPASERTVG